MRYPSPSAKTAPIGTQYAAPQPLTEQRVDGTYHQRMPWPDRDAERLQGALIDSPSPRAGWGTALTCLTAVASSLILIKGCA